MPAAQAAPSLTSLRAPAHCFASCWWPTAARLLCALCAQVRPTLQRAACPSPPWPPLLPPPHAVAARRLGIPTVAVFSQADVAAVHARYADEAVCIGPPPSTESYLRIPHLVDAIKRTGADAVHPGVQRLRREAHAECTWVRARTRTNARTTARRVRLPLREPGFCRGGRRGRRDVCGATRPRGWVRVRAEGSWGGECACSGAGLAPPPHQTAMPLALAWAVQAMGDKVESKRCANEAGVNTIPGGQWWTA